MKGFRLGVPVQQSKKFVSFDFRPLGDCSEKNIWTRWKSIKAYEVWEELSGYKEYERWHLLIMRDLKTKYFEIYIIETANNQSWITRGLLFKSEFVLDFDYVEGNIKFGKKANVIIGGEIGECFVNSDL